MNWIAEIKKILLKNKGINKELKLETKFRDLGLDSLDLMDLIIAAEKDYHFTIPDAELTQIETVKDLITIIEKLVK